MDSGLPQNLGGISHTRGQEHTSTTQAPHVRILVGWIVKQEACSTPRGAALCEIGAPAGAPGGRRSDGPNASCGMTVCHYRITNLLPRLGAAASLWHKV